MANFNFNKVILGGRLTADPELRQTSGGTSVVSFSIAVTRKPSKDSGQAETDFFNITAWRATADFVSRYFKKGSPICIVGSLRNSTWTDQQGAKHSKTEVVAEEVSFVDSRADAAPTVGNSVPSYTAPAGGNFEEVKEDADLPF